MTAPRRIQRKRTKGWKMPPNTVYVGRPSKWGNPFRVGDYYMAFAPSTDAPLTISHFENFAGCDGEITIIKTPAHAVAAYRDYLKHSALDIRDLRGKNLACWCKLDEPCHADVLLEIANELP